MDAGRGGPCMQATHSIHSTHPKCPVFEPKNSPSRTAFYQSVQKAGGLDALELFNSVVASKAFEVSGWMGWNGMGLCGCLCGGGGGGGRRQAHRRLMLCERPSFSPSLPRRTVPPSAMARTPFLLLLVLFSRLPLPPPHALLPPPYRKSWTTPRYSTACSRTFPCSAPSRASWR